MASLLKWARKVKDQIDPFDGGKTWSNPTGAPQAQAPIQRAGFNPNLQNRNTPVQMGNMRINNQGPAPGIESTLKPIDVARELITRPLANLTVSASDFAVPGKQSYNPSSKLEQAVFGKKPITSYQDRYAGSRATLGQSDNPLVRGTAPLIAGAGQVINIASDVPVVGALAKGGKMTVKAGLKQLPDLSVMKPLGEAGGLHLPTRVTTTQEEVLKNLAEDTIRLSTKLKTKAGITPLDQSGKVQLPFGPKQKSVDSLPKLSTKKQKTYTPGENPLTITDKAIRQTDTNLDKLAPGIKFDLTKRKELGDTIAGSYKAKLNKTSQLKKEEELNYVQVLEGKAKPINSNVAEAAKETRKVLNSIYYQAKGNVPDMKGRRQNYFPRMYDPKTFKSGSKQFNKTAQDLVDSKKAANLDEAEALIMKFKPSNKRKQSGNLTKSRTKDLPGYVQSREAIEHYIDKTAREIAHYKTFGKKEAALGKYRKGVGKQWGDDAVEDFDKMYNRVSNINQKPSKLSSGLTNFQGATKLGTSSILNATQNVQTAVIGGGARTAKNLVKQAKPNAVDADFLKRANVADDQVAHEQLFAQTGISTNMKIGTKKHNVSARSVMAPGFEAIEKMNRRTAALTGRDLAASLAKKAHKGNIKAQTRLNNEFGITSYRGGKLTKADEVKAGRNMVRRTQFHTNPEDLPTWMSSNTGKVLSQFKRYPYKQAQFVGREVLKPLAKGNVVPAARLGAIGAPVAIGAHEVQSKLRGSDYEAKNPVGKALDLTNKITGGDLVTSTIGALNPQGAYSGEAYATKVAKLLGGPTVSDGVKLFQAVGDGLGSKKDLKNAGRLGLTHIPVVGTPISNRVLPYGEPSAKAADPNKLDKATPQEKDALAKKEEGKIKDTAGEYYGLTKLSNGKYAYTLEGDNAVHTTGDLKEARKQIAEHTFGKTGAESKVIGEKYFYRNENDEVKSMPKYRHEYDLVESKANLDMDVAKEEGDLTAWGEAATAKLAALKTLKAKYNKDSQQDKVDDTEKKIFDLMKQMHKYDGYGGFTKGGGSGGGGGGSSKFITSGLNTAGDLKMPKASGIKVRQPSMAAFKPGTKKLSVRSVPGGYINRKLG
jgi:hypothetical protein